MISLSNLLSKPSSDVSSSRSSSSSGANLCYDITVYEPLTPSYSLLLHTYRYRIHSSVGNTRLNSHPVSTTNTPDNRTDSSSPYAYCSSTGIHTSSSCQAHTHDRRHSSLSYTVWSLPSFTYTSSSPHNYDLYVRDTLQFTLPTICLPSSSTPLDSSSSSSSSSSSKTNSTHSTGNSTSVSNRVSVYIQYKAAKSFLSREYFAPDAHRGVNIPPTIIHINSTPTYHTSTSTNNTSNTTSNNTCTASNTTSYVYDRLMYTNMPLIMLPTPDFSMPYNVITLVNTLTVYILSWRICVSYLCMMCYVVCV